MRQTSTLVILILGVLASVHGQAKPERNSSPATRPAANATAKKPKYLIGSLDLTQTNLGQNFMGHDITAVVEAIKNDPALKEKSEFESTSEFETRRAGFVQHPLYANLTLSGYVGFVVGEQSIFAPEFKYDADSQMLAITLTGNTQRFVSDEGKPTLDSVLIRHIDRDKDFYIGSNAFGAKVEVRRSYAEEYGVVFKQDNWVFQVSSEAYRRIFKYSLAMTADEARALKPDAKLLVVCRLTPPWFRYKAHGHDATIDEPYDTTVGDNYLEAIPDQLWIFNQRTGSVVHKVSESSLASERDEQLNLKLQQTPLLLEVSPTRISSIKIIIDAEPARSDLLLEGTKTFAAKHLIVLTLEHPQSLFDLTFKLNGKRYTPNWSKVTSQMGSYELINSATAVITVP